MSVIAILNAVKDNIFVKRFCSDLQIGSAVELLQEKIPVEAHIFEDGYHHPVKAQKPSDKSISIFLISATFSICIDCSILNLRNYDLMLF